MAEGQYISPLQSERQAERRVRRKRIFEFGSVADAEGRVKSPLAEGMNSKEAAERGEAR